MSFPPALTIAGSDSSGGAGIQADLKTFSASGVHGLCAVTCLVAETPKVVSEIHPVPPFILQQQIRLLLASYPIGALKTGMLFSKAHIVAVCELLGDCNIPIVVDPVMVASTGAPLLEESALDAISERLLPLATIITPNLPEAGILLGRPVLTLDEQEAAAHELAEKFSCACYLKGGHLEGTQEHRDLLVQNGKLEVFSAPHLDLPSTHGTGCTLSASMTAELAKGHPLSEAAAHSNAFTHRALKDSRSWKSPKGSEIWHLDQDQRS
ncbi:bifunctional hydroxymethylpyrimidine kinase/phosphomethylpyrimidine kinase [Akkermansiaceae bacterium]|nr:bifunctional hydroxymethylpyrimidine kinase/phosphomethylpyrimidine kinase [Akkermansiaceae bacterium]